jgi:ankyrin repeat protein
MGPSLLRFGIKSGWTALITASYRGHLAVVEALLAKGADREAKANVRAPETHPPL